MTHTQMRMYRAEWAKARTAIEDKRGRMSTAEADIMRRQIHADVAAPDSSKDFTNKDLDSVLAAFFAWSRADDLLTQLHLQDQPETRARYLSDDMLDRIEATLDASGRQQQADKVRKGFARDGYLLYLLRRLNPNADLPTLDSARGVHWQQVNRALVYRHDQVVRAARHPQGQGRRPSKRVAKSRQEDTRRRAPDTPEPIPAGDLPW